MRLQLLAFVFTLTVSIGESVHASSVPDSFTREGLYSHSMKELDSAQNTEERFYALADASLRSYEVGKIDEAKTYANELLKLAASFKSNWNYGNAVHKGNIVLGRIALKNDDIEQAKEYLHRAGDTPGSPQLNSFGPNMTLAKELLEKSESDAVKMYLKQCKKFWEMDYDKLEFWTFQIDKGKIPQFGANLLY